MARDSAQKVGIYVDVSNITRNGGHGMRYDILRDFACREGDEPIRLNAYVAYDEERARTDIDYKERTLNFYSTLRDYGYKVIEKPVTWYEDETGLKYGKANADLDMAVDTLLQSENLDRVLLATGDGDFVQVVKALQNKGCRVEAVAFQNVSSQLKREVDLFFSGYLIPQLLPIKENEERGVRWGEIGSRVRGICYSYNHAKNYGFMRFLKHIGPGLWVTDTRRPESPYETAFAHESNFDPAVDMDKLPNREYIFEFDIVEGEEGRFQAVNISRIFPRG
ncbi:MAG TPA: NYN domain-containing protein [Deltaproteobacteria bacterium]|nr:NYN domain-containing protein [Deltaproteobacteria bacterium]